MLHLASEAIDAKPLSSCDTFKKPFFLTEMLIILKPNTFPTGSQHHLCVLSSQISVPIRDTHAPFAAVFVMCLWLHALCTHWVVSDQCFCVCARRGCAPTWTCTYMCEPRAVLLGLLLAFSSPVGQSSVGEDGRFLWRKLWEFSCPGQFVSQIHNQAT